MSQNLISHPAGTACGWSHGSRITEDRTLDVPLAEVAKELKKVGGVAEPGKDAR